MTREEAISVLEESKRQNEIMRDNPNTFFKVSDIVTGEKNAQKRIDALNMAISALRQQDHFREATKKVEPLMLDELRQIDGEPVFLVDLVHKSDPKVPDLWGGWIVFTKHDQNGFIPRGGGFFSNDGYGKTWLAYRQKPEEDSSND